MPRRNRKADEHKRHVPIELAVDCWSIVYHAAIVQALLKPADCGKGD